MNAPADLRARPSAADVAGIVERLTKDFADRAVTSNAIREQHGHGEGMADAALPDVVVFRIPTRRSRRSCARAMRHTSP